MSVNAAWRRFDSAEAMQRPGHSVGFNYIEICDTGQLKILPSKKLLGQQSVGV
jgi:hypothetical protein